MSYVPNLDEMYVKTPFYDTLKTIVDSGEFFPVLVTGPSGVAKTLTIEQLCHDTDREMFRVNITIESDEDALMGGFRLIDGNTVFHKGPVIMAMERGGILLLDELDLGSPTRIMCLQSVLEGKGYYIKKTNEWVLPKDGFTVIATANTKGTGDEDGKYTGTQILNEAALDRFPITIEVDYPKKDEETAIMKNVFAKLGLEDEKALKHLVAFASHVREEVRKDTNSFQYNISTRRLVNIARAYKIFGNLKQAVTLSLARFDVWHRDSFIKFFDMMKPVDQSDLDAINNKTTSGKTVIDFSQLRPF